MLTFLCQRQLFIAIRTCLKFYDFKPEAFSSSRGTVDPRSFARQLSGWLWAKKIVLLSQHELCGCVVVGCYCTRDLRLPKWRRNYVLWPTVQLWPIFFKTITFFLLFFDYPHILLSEWGEVPTNPYNRSSTVLLNRKRLRTYIFRASLNQHLGLRLWGHPINPVGLRFGN